MNRMPCTLAAGHRARLAPIADRDRTWPSPLSLVRGILPSPLSLVRGILPSPLAAVRRGLVAAALACALPGLALAQAFPSKPVRFIVSFPPGGAADQIARAVSQPLQEALGQPVVVENRAGANGNIAGEFVARQPADGHTLLMSSGGTVSINPHLYPKMPFDPVKDLTPVAAAARVLVFLEVNPAKVPVQTAQEFVAYLKKNPGKLTFGSPGNGSSPHLAAEMMKAQAGVFATHIPYRGAAPAMQDLLAGQIDFMFDPGIGLQQVKAGKLKLLAVGSPQRAPQFPDVPTMDEAGLKGFDADSWFGFYAPAGTPAAVVAKLNTEINKVLRSPAFIERMNAIGAIPVALTPQAFADRAQADSQRFGALIRARNIRGD